MLDNLKIRTFNQTLINRLYGRLGFDLCRALNNNFESFQHCFGLGKFKLHFFKAKGGYAYLDICISPHYHFNDYRHNGNYFSVKDCKYSLTSIFKLLKITPEEFTALQVVNIEFGVNIIPEVPATEIIKGVVYYKKTPFNNIQKLEFAKISTATAHKQIKIYAKGLQFEGMEEMEETNGIESVHPNTLRFEVKSKKQRFINQLGIWSVADLFKDEVYQKLGQNLLDEFQQVHILNLSLDLEQLKPKEREYISKANNAEFWSDLIKGKHRNSFKYNKEKYNRILEDESLYKSGVKKIKHSQILGLILDQILPDFE